MPHQFSAENVITSGSSRRLRGSHYLAQRASICSQDALPLIRKPIASQQTAAAIRRPSQQRNIVKFPQQAYQPAAQAHQLIAVCFNHMAGRQCEHCQQMYSTLNDGQPQGRTEQHSDSNETLGHQQNGNRSSDYEDIERENDGGEKGGQQGPPAPVGLFDKRLGSLRLQCLKLWARTGRLSFDSAFGTSELIVWQF